jgi:ABC-type uncharacterized transport system permease subunit
MTEALSTAAFALALILYAGASGLFFLSVARSQRPQGRSASGSVASEGAASSRGRAPASAPPPSPSQDGPRTDLAPYLLGGGALGHLAYVMMASFVANVCPIRSVHFILSFASLFGVATYLLLRRRFDIDALGLLVGPLGLAFLLGTYFLAKPEPAPRFSMLFITLHVLANLLGVALFVLAGGAAGLYLVQERRIKVKKRAAARIHGLPPLDALDHAVHRFLVAGFPLLTLGIITGTYWAKTLEMGSPDVVMRTIFGYATWLLIAGVLLLRALAGWRGRRAAYGTIAGLVCVAAVLFIYLVRPPGSGVAPPHHGGAPGKAGALAPPRGAPGEMDAPAREVGAPGETGARRREA